MNEHAHHVLRDKIALRLPQIKNDLIDDIIDIVLRQAENIVCAQLLLPDPPFPENLEYAKECVLRDFWNKCREDNVVPIFEPIVQQQSTNDGFGKMLVVRVEEPCRSLLKR